MNVKGIGDNGFFSDIRRAAEIVPPREENRKTERTGDFVSALRGKTDTVEISRRQPESTVLQDSKDQVMQELKRSADQVTLDGLRNRIASGTYAVRADELAGILGE